VALGGGDGWAGIACGEVGGGVVVVALGGGARWGRWAGQVGKEVRLLGVGGPVSSKGSSCILLLTDIKIC
jgi:hypothetical protein